MFMIETVILAQHCMYILLLLFIFQIGTEIMPKSGATRIIASFWWLFCLICVASYTANLAAFLTKSKMTLQIKSADDLARQTDIPYGCYAGGSTRRFFSVSDNWRYLSWANKWELSHLLASDRQKFEKIFHEIVFNIPLVWSRILAFIKDWGFVSSCVKTWTQNHRSEVRR